MMQPKKNKNRLWLLLLIVFLFSVSIVSAQNKVVVIPLFDDSKSKSLKVYDSSNPPQYLGILVGYTPSQQSRDGLIDLIKIFIPKLKKLIYISLNQTDYWQTAGDVFGDNVWYTQALCNGSPYIDYSYVIVRSYLGNLYYSENLRTSITFSSELDSTGCHASSGERSVFMALEIPETDIPFTLPVTLPLRFEYE